MKKYYDGFIKDMKEPITTWRANLQMLGASMILAGCSIITMLYTPYKDVNQLMVWVMVAFGIIIFLASGLEITRKEPMKNHAEKSTSENKPRP